MYVFGQLESSLLPEDPKTGLGSRAQVLITCMKLLRLGITAGAATAAKVFASPTLYDGCSG